MASPRSTAAPTSRTSSLIRNPAKVSRPSGQFGITRTAKPGRRNATIPVESRPADDFMIMGQRFEQRDERGRADDLTPFCCAWNWMRGHFRHFRFRRAFGAMRAIGRAATGLAARGLLSRSQRRTRRRAGVLSGLPDAFGQSWSIHYKPRFSTRTAAKASGRETRAGDDLAAVGHRTSVRPSSLGGAFAELQQVIGFVAPARAQQRPSCFPPCGAKFLLRHRLGSGMARRRPYPEQVDRRVCRARPGADQRPDGLPKWRCGFRRALFGFDPAGDDHLHRGARCRVALTI